MKPLYPTRLILCIGLAMISTFSCFPQLNSSTQAGVWERAYLVARMIQIADPVLNALAENNLRDSMPVETNGKDRESFSSLEAFGRTLAGIAPWLELGTDSSSEGKLRGKYIKLARIGLDHATDSTAADYMNFNKGKQPLVDAAFLAQALLRAPRQLWIPLSDRVKRNIINALKSTRIIMPPNSNWVLFSAEIEAALLKYDGVCEESRIDYALKMHEQWYKGDGTYGDGPNYHWDYYNSFVIHPMLLEVMQVLSETKNAPEIKTKYNIELKRAKRYAYVQESLISPEGSYPALGRSLTYRFGAFHLLSKMALMKELPVSLRPRQIRAALFSVIKRQIQAKGAFDQQGWLTIGFYGHQPAIGEGYISTGSLYLCSQAFIMLGLTPEDEFWTGADEAWTSLKLYNGIDLSVDHSIN